MQCMNASDILAIYCVISYIYAILWSDSCTYITIILDWKKWKISKNILSYVNNTPQKTKKFMNNSIYQQIVLLFW